MAIFLPKEHMFVVLSCLRQRVPWLDGKFSGVSSERRMPDVDRSSRGLVFEAESADETPH